MKKVKLALIGAGLRGYTSYGPYATKHPNEVAFVAVAEPDPVKRERFSKAHNIPDEMCFANYDEMFAQPQLADGVLICTQDSMHKDPAIKALKKGYHVMLEKPMANNPYECQMIGEYAQKCNRVFLICHVLRYAEFFARIKEILDSGAIGRLLSIQHNENVAYWHYAHGFVRGDWNKAEESSPVILAKCCHDMDILLWLAGSDCRTISSFGSLTHFKKENAPEGAPLYCMDGCPAEETCPHYAPRLYLTENTYWPTASLGVDLSLPSRIKALKDGPYGRCVFHCDNNVVDHQVAAMEFENDVTAVFTMGCTKIRGRSIKLMGTMGELRGSMDKNEIEVIDFLTETSKVYHLTKPTSGHGGGDYGLMRSFLALIRSNAVNQGLTNAAISVQSHLMAFAAEKARLTGKTVDMRQYIEEVKAGLRQLKKEKEE